MLNNVTLPFLAQRWSLVIVPVLASVPSAAHRSDRRRLEQHVVLSWELIAAGLRAIPRCMGYDPVVEHRIATTRDLLLLSGCAAIELNRQDGLALCSRPRGLAGLSSPLSRTLP